MSRAQESKELSNYVAITYAVIAFRQHAKGFINDPSIFPSWDAFAATLKTHFQLFNSEEGLFAKTAT